MDVPYAVRQWLMEKGTSVEYGARELKRTVHRFLTQPLGTMVARGEVPASCCVLVGIQKDGAALALGVAKAGMPRGCSQPTLLVVDGNGELARFIERMMAAEGWDVLVASTAAEAKRMAAKRKPHGVMMDAELPDGRGVNLAVQLGETMPGTRSVVMTEEALPLEENMACARLGVAVLQKPFLVKEALGVIRAQLGRRSLGRMGAPLKVA